MGVLVHRAFPDEQANGVLVTRNLADPLTDGIYVNVQKGEESVTNPLAGITPEIFTIIPGPEWGSVQVARIAYSSLQPDSPLLTDAEIALLNQTARTVRSHFAPLYGIAPASAAVLEMEFKFHGDSRDFVLKQVRPFLQSSQTK